MTVSSSAAFGPAPFIVQVESEQIAVINAPSNLTGSGGKASATLKWSDNSSNETGFYIERAASGSTNFARVDSVAANVKIFTDVVARGAYTYRVQAFNATNLSAYSNSLAVRVK